MLDSGSSDGSITLKFDVSLAKEYIPNNDPEIEGKTREIHKPVFKHKVSSTVTVKDELSGNKNTEMELVWDEEKQMYVLAYIANTEQRSIFDKDQPWNQTTQGEEMLETAPDKSWRNVPLLPGEVADENALPEEEELLENAMETEDEPEENDDYGYEEPEDEDESEDNE